MSPRTIAILAAILLVIIFGTVSVMKRSMRAGPGSIDALETRATTGKPPPPPPAKP